MGDLDFGPFLADRTRCQKPEVRESRRTQCLSPPLEVTICTEKSHEAFVRKHSESWQRRYRGVGTVGSSCRCCCLQVDQGCHKWKDQIHAKRRGHRGHAQATDRHTYIHTYIHAHMHAYIPACMHTYTDACKHACMQTCIHAHMHTCTHIDMYVSTLLMRPVLQLYFLEVMSREWQKIHVHICVYGNNAPASVVMNALVESSDGMLLLRSSDVAGKNGQRGCTLPSQPSS